MYKQVHAFLQQGKIKCAASARLAGHALVFTHSFAFVCNIYMETPGSGHKFFLFVNTTLDDVIQPNEGSRVWLNNIIQRCVNKQKKFVPKPGVSIYIYIVILTSSRGIINIQWGQIHRSNKYEHVTLLLNWQRRLIHSFRGKALQNIADLFKFHNSARKIQPKPFWFFLKIEQAHHSTRLESSFNNSI